MNPLCQRCGALNGCNILRQRGGDRWLRLGVDCFYYDADGQRVRLADVPKGYADCPVTTVKVDIVLVRGTAMRLCQHCQKRVKDPRRLPRQRDFFHLVEIGKPR